MWSLSLRTGIGDISTRVLLGPNALSSTHQKGIMSTVSVWCVFFFLKSKRPEALKARDAVWILKNGSFILIYNQFGYPAVTIHGQKIRPSSVQPGNDMYPLSVYVDIYSAKVQQTGQNSVNQE